MTPGSACPCACRPPPGARHRSPPAPRCRPPARHPGDRTPCGPAPRRLRRRPARWRRMSAAWRLRGTVLRSWRSGWGGVQVEVWPRAGLLGDAGQGLSGTRLQRLRRSPVACPRGVCSTADKAGPRCGRRGHHHPGRTPAQRAAPCRAGRAGRALQRHGRCRHPLGRVRAHPLDQVGSAPPQPATRRHAPRSATASGRGRSRPALRACSSPAASQAWRCRARSATRATACTSTGRWRCGPQAAVQAEPAGPARGARCGSMAMISRYASGNPRCRCAATGCGCPSAGAGRRAHPGSLHTSARPAPGAAATTRWSSASGRARRRLSMPDRLATASSATPAR